MDLPRPGGRPLALILTGGAAFGSWQAGALYDLCARGLGFKAVFGASAGALNGVAYFQDSLELMRERWTNVRRSDFWGLGPRLNPPSLLSLERFRRYLLTYIDEDRAKRVGRGHLFVITADIASGTMFQARYTPGGREGWDGPLVDHVLGSCAIPGLFPPVRVRSDGGPERLLLDGGMREFTDLGPAFELGCRDFLFIDIVHAASLRRPRFGLLKYFATLAEQLVEAHVHNTLEALRPRAELLARDGETLRAWVLRPSRHVDLDALNFDRKGCAEAFALGQADAAAFLADPAPARTL